MRKVWCAAGSLAFLCSAAFGDDVHAPPAATPITLAPVAYKVKDGTPKGGTSRIFGSGPPTPAPSYSPVVAATA
jgi:hypothetical protein